jgi:hypothetical protein
MRLYSLNKQEFCLVFISFFALYTGAIIIGWAGPPITATMHHSTKVDVEKNPQPTFNHTDVVEPPPIVSLNTGPLILRTPALSAYNRQLWLVAIIKIRNRAGKHIDRISIN